MELTDIAIESGKGIKPQVVQGLSQKLEEFLSPLLGQSDEQIDKRVGQSVAVENWQTISQYVTTTLSFKYTPKTQR